MLKITSITALGALVFLTATPFMAIFRDWKDYIFIVSGLAIVVLSIMIRRELNKVLKVLHGDETESIKDTYIENNPQ